MWTASPRTSSPTRSTSPVCRPARTSRPTDPIAFRLVARASEELLDLTDDAPGIADPWEVVVTRHLDKRRTRDVLGEIPPCADCDHAVAGAVKDQRRDANRLEDGANVDLGV